MEYFEIRIVDFGFKNTKSAADTGNQPEGWESEEQVRFNISEFAIQNYFPMPHAPCAVWRAQRATDLTKN